MSTLRPTAIVGPAATCTHAMLRMAMPSSTNVCHVESVSLLYLPSLIPRHLDPATMLPLLLALPLPRVAASIAALVPSCHQPTTLLEFRPTLSRKHCQAILKLLHAVAVERDIEITNNPIHDQLFFLDAQLRRRLRDEYNVRGWRLVQRRGDAIFIPAGCPHQVRTSYAERSSLQTARARR